MKVEAESCAECAQTGVELFPCAYGCGETLCADCLSEHERECPDNDTIVLGGEG